MRKIGMYLLVLLFVGLLPGCRNAAEKARERIGVEAVERIERQGLTGIELVLRVKNDTGYKLRLDAAQLELYYADSRVGTILLREPVEVARRTTGAVTTLWRLKIADPLALFVLAKRIDQGGGDAIRVSYQIAAKGGPAHANLSREKVPLSEFLSTFGLSMSDLSNFLKK